MIVECSPPGSHRPRFALRRHGPHDRVPVTACDRHATPADPGLKEGVGIARAGTAEQAL